jgi:hypothetical protein
MPDFFSNFEQFIQSKGYTFNSLERELDIGTGTFGKAKRLNSKLSVKTISKIKNRFPELDFDKLYQKEYSNYLDDEHINKVNESLTIYNEIRIDKTLAEVISSQQRTIEKLTDIIAGKK